MKISQLEQIEKLFDYDIPEYLKIKNTNRIAIKTDSKFKDITIDDVISYFKYDARNISSGMRSIGNITGDWRPIDELAQMCLSIFKVLNIKRLKKTALQSGLEPKF